MDGNVVTSSAHCLFNFLVWSSTCALINKLRSYLLKYSTSNISDWMGNNGMGIQLGIAEYNAGWDAKTVVKNKCNAAAGASKAG